MGVIRRFLVFLLCFWLQDESANGNSQQIWAIDPNSLPKMANVKDTGKGKLFRLLSGNIGMISSLRRPDILFNILLVLITIKIVI